MNIQIFARIEFRDFANFWQFREMLHFPVDKFAKINTREIFWFIQFAKLNSREIQHFQSNFFSTTLS